MVALIMACSLIGSVILISVCGMIAPSAPPSPPSVVTPPAIIEETHSDIYDAYDNEAPSPSATIRGEYGNMRSDEIKSSLREGVVERSIPILRSQGMSDEKIKEKMMESFSLDEETIDRLLSH